MSDTITVLRCARGLRLAKLKRGGALIDYDSTRTFDAWTANVSNLQELNNLIERLIENRRLCVVRGELVAGASAKGIRRLVHRDPETDDAPTLRDVPRQWLALDIEGVERPSGLDLADLTACARFALSHLPNAFRSVACVVQATAGHGIKPDLRLRLWFWLSRPTHGAELSRWLRGSPADPSVFRAAQIIYTARPIFEECEDHLSVRLARLDGAAVVQVPSVANLAPPAPAPQRPVPSSESPGASKYAWTALRNAVARVVAAPVDSRHVTCLSQARSLARLVGPGLINGRDIQSAMGEALFQAGKTREEGEAIAIWALAHPSIASLPKIKSIG
jgi:hypothetical protein